MIVVMIYVRWWASVFFLSHRSKKDLQKLLHPIWLVGQWSCSDYYQITASLQRGGNYQQFNFSWIKLLNRGISAAPKIAVRAAPPRKNNWPRHAEPPVYNQYPRRLRVARTPESRRRFFEVRATPRRLFSRIVRRRGGWQRALLIPINTVSTLMLAACNQHGRISQWLSQHLSLMSALSTYITKDMGMFALPLIHIFSVIIFAFFTNKKGNDKISLIHFREKLELG